MTVLNKSSLAADVLCVLALRRQEPLTLLDLEAAIGARRVDVRRMVSRLHQEGFVDALRMRPTLAGFALARALGTRKPRALRFVLGAAFAAVA